MSTSAQHHDYEAALSSLRDIPPSHSSTVHCCPGTSASPPTPDRSLEASSSERGKAPAYSFEKVATTFAMYWVALLNYDNSVPEEKDVNAQRLDAAATAVYRVFDEAENLDVATQQLLFVFLKELHYDST